MTKRLIGSGVACVLALVLLASTTARGQDMTTQLSFFLNDLYAGAIGTTISTKYFAVNSSATAPGFSFSGDTNTGFYRDVADSDRIRVTNGGTQSMGLSSGGPRLANISTVGWSSTSDPYATSDLFLARDAAAILALKNADTAQTLRVYGATTGSKYLILTHDGTNPKIDSSSGALKIGSTAVTPASTGTRYICIDTAGVIASSATACSGT
jgi:hypothetical protein